jgi:hypothetical protein
LTAFSPYAALQIGGRISRSGAARMAGLQCAHGCSGSTSCSKTEDAHPGVCGSRGCLLRERALLNVPTTVPPILQGAIVDDS